MIDISEYKTLAEVRKAAQEDFAQNNPKPTAPTKTAAPRRPQIIDVGQGRMWLEVSRGYNGAQVNLCQTGRSDTQQVRAEELQALLSEIQRAIADQHALAEEKAAEEAYEKAMNIWSQNLNDAKSAVVYAWRKAHPDAPEVVNDYDDEDDEDYDDDEDDN